MSQCRHFTAPSQHSPLQAPPKAQRRGNAGLQPPRAPLAASGRESASRQVKALHVTAWRITALHGASLYSAVTSRHSPFQAPPKARPRGCKTCSPLALRSPHPAGKARHGRSQRVTALHGASRRRITALHSASCHSIARFKRRPKRGRAACGPAASKRARPPRRAAKGGGGSRRRRGV